MATAFGIEVHPFRPPGIPGRVARVAVGVDMVASLALAGAAFVTAAGDDVWRLPPLGTSRQTTFSFHPEPVNRFFGLSYAVSVAAGVAWVVWQHRAQTNVWATAGANRPRISPAWAVGWWFIPFANWWMPFVAVRELHTRSSPVSGRRRAAASATLGAWWALWLSAAAAGILSGGLLVGVMISAFVEAGSPSVVIAMAEIAPAIQILGTGYVLRAASGVLAIALIGDVERAQAAIHAVAAEPGTWVPIPPRPDVA